MRAAFVLVMVNGRKTTPKQSRGSVFPDHSAKPALNLLIYFEKSFFFDTVGIDRVFHHRRSAKQEGVVAYFKTGRNLLLQDIKSVIVTHATNVSPRGEGCSDNGFVVEKKQSR